MGLVDIENIISMFSENKTSAYKLYQDFMVQTSEDKFIDITEEDNGAEEEANRGKFNSMMKERGISPVAFNKRNITDEFIAEYRRETGLSVKNIAEIMKINKDRVNKAIKI